MQLSAISPLVPSSLGGFLECLESPIYFVLPPPKVFNIEGHSIDF